MRMSSWQDALQHLGARHPGLEHLEAGAVRVSVTCRDQPRPITVRSYQVAGAAWLEVSAPLGKARFLPPAMVLVRNFMLPIGAVGIADGAILLRQTLPIAGLRTEDLDTLIDAIADGLESMPAEPAP